MNDIRKPEDGFVFPSCPGKPRVPSDGEVEALEALRAIKERVRHLKAELAALRREPVGGDGAAVSGIQSELSRLRAEWKSWEKRREAAARERMILLGHEDGPV